MRPVPHAILLALMTAGAATFAGADPIAVTIADTACMPTALTAPAGDVPFVVTNGSSRALEWEILQGVMIVAEREKILPGFKQSLNVTLRAGDCAMTCGLLSNPKGVIAVTGVQMAEASDPMELVGPVAEHKVWIRSEADAFVAATAAFTAAVKAGDLARHRAAQWPCDVAPLADRRLSATAPRLTRRDDAAQHAGVQGWHLEP